MTAIDKRFFSMDRMDTLSYADSPLHRMDPRAKLITTLIYIVMVVSFGKYEISALIPFFIYPVVLMAWGNLPIGFILRKMLLVAPFAILIGIFNPLMDQNTLIQIGRIEISGGWVSFISILIRFTLTVGAALILVGATGFNAVCMALEKLGTPRIFVVQLLFLYRYLFVLGDEATKMVRARSLRTFNAHGMGIKTFGSMVGHLLLRTMDRAQRIHTAMSCRGFDGHIRIIRTYSMGQKELGFILGWTIFFIIIRIYNVPQWMGLIILGLIS